MKIDCVMVSSLGEYMDCIKKIAKEESGSSQHSPVLWFRGLSHFNHSLIPSLFRSEVRVHRKDEMGDYSSMHYAEDIRTQHYIAKNYHFFEKEPSSRVEWLEVMQHHGVSTRVLDWSESSIHSLLFALEPYLDYRRDRDTCVPCVWVLNPRELNKKIFDYLKDKRKVQKKLIAELEPSNEEKKEILNMIQRFTSCAIYNESPATGHLDYVVNLSEINDEILRDRSRLKYLLRKGDIINPYFYLLSRIYSDGYILNRRELPPLAMVHPYHSERIKAQKGVFTIFPYYMEQENDKVLRKAGINPDAMEKNLMAAGCLHKIILHSAQEIASELLINGMFDSWLYPELPIAANEIENRRIYF